MMKISEIRDNKVDADRLTVLDMVDSAIDNSETYNKALKFIDEKLPSGLKTSRTLRSAYESFIGLQTAAKTVIRKLAYERGIDHDSLDLERKADVTYNKVSDDSPYFEEYKRDFLKQIYNLAKDAMNDCRTYDKALDFIDKAWTLTGINYPQSLAEKNFRETVDEADNWVRDIAMSQKIHDSERHDLKKHGKKLVDKEFDYE